MKNKIKILEASGIKVISNMISKVDLEKAIQVLATLDSKTAYAIYDEVSGKFVDSMSGWKQDLTDKPQRIKYYSNKEDALKYIPKSRGGSDPFKDSVFVIVKVTLSFEKVQPNL